MTMQYLAGELSLLLARVPVVAAEPAAVAAGVELRRLAETVPIADLGGIVVQALALINGLCWESLERGDVMAFAHQAELGAELREFGECARLLGGT